MDTTETLPAVSQNGALTKRSSFNGNGNGRNVTKAFEKFREICDKLYAQEKEVFVALLTHPTPDPDAISSQMGLAWLLTKRYNFDCELFYTGEISHPQNNVMVNLLGPKLIPMEEFNPERYDLKILVDTIPSNTGFDSSLFDVVIDHHVEVPTCEDEENLFVNIHTGSCATTIYMLIKYLELDFDADGEEDSNIATALLTGLITDTDDRHADRTTDYDNETYQYLFPYRDADTFQKIIKFKRPMAWVTIKALAVGQVVIEKGVAIVGLGMVTNKQRDIIADMADDMLGWESVDIAIAFAVVDGHWLNASIRSNNSSVSAAMLANDLSKEHKRSGQSNGWGHSNKGGYRYCLGGVSVITSDDEEIQNDTWTLIKKKETKRILNVFKNK